MPQFPRLYYPYNGKLLMLYQYTNLVEDFNNDLRPVSSLPHYPKSYSDFMQIGFLTAFNHKLDPRQFGALSGSSSSFDALINLLHSLYADTDGTRKTVRVCLLDFSKPLDRINYKIIISKMRKLDINELGNSLSVRKETASQNEWRLFRLVAS